MHMQPSVGYTCYSPTGFAKKFTFYLTCDFCGFFSCFGVVVFCCLCMCVEGGGGGGGGGGRF